jgi:Transposase DDE domain group 1
MVGHAPPIRGHYRSVSATAIFHQGSALHPGLLVSFQTKLPYAGRALSALRPTSRRSLNEKSRLKEVLAQLPEPWRDKECPKLARSDSAGASHKFVKALCKAGFQFSIGLAVQSWVREAIFAVPESEWVPALDQDGQERDGAEVCELRSLDLSGWPKGTRAICRRERAHPGAQLRLWEAGRGIRHQVFITDQSDLDPALLEARHRCRARIEDGIRCAKATGLTNFPSTFAAFNRVWLELLLTGQCLMAWTQRLCLSGEARIWEPKRLRQCLLHVAARVVRTGRRTIIRLQQDWPWSHELAHAFTRLRALPTGP